MVFAKRVFEGNNAGGGREANSVGNVGCEKVVNLHGHRRGQADTRGARDVAFTVGISTVVNGVEVFLCHLGEVLGKYLRGQFHAGDVRGVPMQDFGRFMEPQVLAL